MMNGIKRFIIWLTQPLFQLFDQSYSVELVEDPIDQPKKKILYVVGSYDDPWQVEFLCPCGCADKIVLPVNENMSPRWKMKLTNKNIPSLSPSIWRSKGCRSHFFLRNGKIEWCSH